MLSVYSSQLLVIHLTFSFRGSLFLFDGSESPCADCCFLSTCESSLLISFSFLLLSCLGICCVRVIFLMAPEGLDALCFKLVYCVCGEI